jgi:hypothetical protein
MDDKELYDLLSMLDRLEDLREDLEELALNGRGVADADDDLRQEIDLLGIRDLDDVDRRIAELNAQVDRLGGREGAEGLDEEPEE